MGTLMGTLMCFAIRLIFFTVPFYVPHFNFSTAQPGLYCSLVTLFQYIHVVSHCKRYGQRVNA